MGTHRISLGAAQGVRSLIGLLVVQHGEEASGNGGSCQLSIFPGYR